MYSFTPIVATSPSRPPLGTIPYSGGVKPALKICGCPKSGAIVAIPNQTKRREFIGEF